MGTASVGEERAALLVFAMLGTGLFLAQYPNSVSAPPIPLDHPAPGFGETPGVREAGSGWPRDALRLVIGEVTRSGTGARMALRLESREGTPLSSDRWRILSPIWATFPASREIDSRVHVSHGLFGFEHAHDPGDLIVNLWGLREGEAAALRMVLDIPMVPIEREGRLRWTVERDRHLEVTFIDRYLFLQSDDEGLRMGAHSRGRFSPPTTRGTCLPGLLESYEARDAQGKELPMLFMEGRSWGQTQFGSWKFGEPPDFPLKVEARWLKCGPVTTCRFVVEDIRIPAK